MIRVREIEARMEFLRSTTEFVNDMTPADYVVVDRVDDGVFGVFGCEMAGPSEEFK